MKITITEALAELKLIAKKITKKEEIVMQNLVRYEHLPDAFKEQGGSEKYISSEIQSIADLRDRFVQIRAKIAELNYITTVTIEGKTRTITEWLAWKREIAASEISFYKNIYMKTKSQVDSMNRQPKVVPSPTNQEEPQLAKLIVNVDMGAAVKKDQGVSDLLEKLDGVLSLKNATLTIDL